MMTTVATPPGGGAQREMSHPSRSASMLERQAQAARILARAEAKAGLRDRSATVVDISQARSRRAGKLSGEEGTGSRGILHLPTMEELPSHLPPLLPGQCVSITGSTAALFQLAASAQGEDGWCAVAGMPNAGLLAASQAGIDLERALTVPQLGSNPPRILAGLIDGLDVVVCGPVRMGQADAGRLAARVRTRRGILISAAPWPGASWSAHIEGVTWDGMNAGLGYAHRTGVEVNHGHIRGATAW